MAKNVPSITFAGRTLTPAQLTSDLQSLVTIKGTVTSVVIAPVASTPEQPQHQQAEPPPVQQTAGSATPRNGQPQG